MKSVFKRFLLLGMSLAVVVLVATQSWENVETESSAGKDTESGGSPASPLDPPGAEQKAPPAEHKTIPFKPLAGTTVTFSGTVVRAGSRFALRETAGVLYMLDSAGRAWPFEGEDVRVTGKLDTTTRLLHIDEIQAMIA